MNTVVDIKYVQEAGFSPAVVNIFTETSRGAAMLKKIMDEREAMRNLRRQTRELAKLATS